jgi:hypothetical protein
MIAAAPAGGGTPLRPGRPERSAEGAGSRDSHRTARLARSLDTLGMTA